MVAERQAIPELSQDGAATDTTLASTEYGEVSRAQITDQGPEARAQTRTAGTCTRPAGKPTELEPGVQSLELAPFGTRPERVSARDPSADRSLVPSQLDSRTGLQIPPQIAQFNP